MLHLNLDDFIYFLLHNFLYFCWILVLILFIFVKDTCHSAIKFHNLLAVFGSERHLIFSSYCILFNLCLLIWINEKKTIMIISYLVSNFYSYVMNRHWILFCYFRNIYLGNTESTHAHILKRVFLVDVLFFQWNLRETAR